MPGRILGTGILNAEPIVIVVVGTVVRLDGNASTISGPRERDKDAALS
jgi:hypothetical protein